MLNVPFTLLQIPDGIRTFHVMTTTLCCPHSASIGPLPTPHTGRLDGIMVVARTFLLSYSVVIFTEVSLEFFVFDDVGKAMVEARVMFITGNIHTLESKVGVDPNKKGVQPPEQKSKFK
jgi:hypothetical protein